MFAKNQPVGRARDVLCIMLTLASAAVMLMAAQCDDKVWTLGSFKVPPASTPITAPINVPNVPPTSGPHGGSQVVIPIGVGTVLPPGTTLTVRGSSLDSTLATPSPYDVAAGATLEIDVTPEGVVVPLPGISIHLPFDPDVLVAQGFAGSVSALTPAIVEAAIFVTQTSRLASATPSAIHRPTASSSNLSRPYTVRIDGVTGVLTRARFQCVVDAPPVQLYDAEPTVQGFQLPEARWFSPYLAVTLTVGSGHGTLLRDVVPTSPSPQYFWNVASGSSLPNGMVLTVAGMLSGTPESATPLVATTVVIHLQVTDAMGRVALRAFTLPIAPATAGIVTTTNLPPGVVGVTYSQQLTVTGSGGTDPLNYAWTANSSTLAMSGLSLDENSGILSGIPNNNFIGNPRIVAFSVTAADRTTMVPGPSVSLSVAIYKELDVTTPAGPLPSTEPGASYSETLSVVGGQPPLSFGITSGQLPPGLALDVATGLISGVTAAGGLYSFTVAVVDSSIPAQGVTRSFSIHSDAPPTAAIQTTGTTGVIGIDFTLSDAEATMASRYSVAFQYSVNGGVSFGSATAVNFGTLNLQSLEAGVPYSVSWDTSFTFSGQAIGVSAPQAVVFRIAVTDPVALNTGYGTASLTISNPGPVTNPSATTISVVSTTFTGPVVPGVTTFVVPVFLTRGPSHTVGGANYDVEYDSQQFTFVSYADGPTATAAGKGGVIANAQVSGTIRRVRVVLVGFNANAMQNGVIGNLTFTRTQAGAATIPLMVTNVAVTSPQATTVNPSQGVAGVVTLP